MKWKKKEQTLSEMLQEGFEKEQTLSEMLQEGFKEEQEND